MSKKSIVVFVAAFVIVTVVVSVLTARQANRRRAISPVAQTNKALDLDTAPPHFP